MPAHGTNLGDMKMTYPTALQNTLNHYATNTALSEEQRQRQIDKAISNYNKVNGTSITAPTAEAHRAVVPKRDYSNAGAGLSPEHVLNQAPIAQNPYTSFRENPSLQGGYDAYAANHQDWIAGMDPFDRIRAGHLGLANAFSPTEYVQRAAHEQLAAEGPFGESAWTGYVAGSASPRNPSPLVTPPLPVGGGSLSQGGSSAPSPAPVIPPSWMDFYNQQSGGQPSPQPAPQPPGQYQPPSSGQYQPPPQTQAPTGTVNPIWPGMEPFKTGNFASNSSPMDYLGLFRESDPFWGQSLHRKVPPSMGPQHTFPYPGYSNWNDWMGNVYGAAMTSPEQLSDPVGGLTPAPLYDWGTGNRVNYGTVVPGYQLSDQSGESQANVVPGMAELIQAMMSGLNNA